MTHPEELLADYVDGTLSEPERAVVDAHLPTCERCTGEVRIARAAVTALERLEDEPVPFGVTGPVLVEAGRRFEQRRRVAWQRLQWSAGLATAAALVLVVAVNIGREGGEEAAPASTGATAGAEAAAPAESAPGAALEVGLERQPGVDYDADGIEAVASAALEDLAGGDEQRTSAVAEDAIELAAGPAEGALACVARSGGPAPGPRDTLLRLIEAEYDGTPAFIAVFAQGPGAGQAPDHVVVWVVATEDCRILTTASSRIPPS